MSELDVNVVMTFEDEEGERWITAAFMGDLRRETSGDHDDQATMGVSQMIDHAMVLVDFKVVRRSP